MKFNEKLKELRISKGLSRRELATLSEISNRTIEKYEQGIREPSPEYAEKLASALEVEPIELISTLKSYEDITYHIATKHLDRLDLISDIFLVNKPKGLEPRFNIELLRLLEGLSNNLLRTENKKEFKKLEKALIKFFITGRELLNPNKIKGTESKPLNEIDSKFVLNRQQVLQNRLRETLEEIIQLIEINEDQVREMYKRNDTD